MGLCFHMKRQSLSKNFIYQFLYQVIILVIPLILSPYLTRILLDKGLGIYSYANSIAYYFVMLGMLGIMRHGQRVIAQRLDDQILLRRTFWSLFAVHSITSIIALILYLFYLLFIHHESQSVYVIESFYVASSLFDITWLFYGLENFRSVVIKNALVQIAQCVLIFLFVKTPRDLNLYTLIVAAGTLVGQLIMLPQAITMVKPIKFSAADMKEHLKPLLIFSISVVAVTLYTVFDKTLLGLMTTKENVAYYDYANKIIIVPKTITSVISTVMFPRACILAEKGDVEGQKRYLSYSFVFTSFVGMGALFGILAIGVPFATYYYGEQFRISGYVMMAMSPLVYIVGTGDILRTQYLIPNHMDRLFNICILLNAVVNIIVSTLLIPYFGIFGAVIGTICAELFGLIFQTYLCRKYIRMNSIILHMIPFAIFGITMYGAMVLISKFFNNTIQGFIMETLVGLFIYLILSAIYIFYTNPELKSKLKTVMKKNVE